MAIDYNSRKNNQVVMANLSVSIFCEILLAILSFSFVIVGIRSLEWANVEITANETNSIEIQRDLIALTEINPPSCEGQQGHKRH